MKSLRFKTVNQTKTHAQQQSLAHCMGKFGRKKDKTKNKKNFKDLWHFGGDDFGSKKLVLRKKDFDLLWFLAKFGLKKNERLEQ